MSKDAPSQVLSFHLAEQDFAVDLLRVLEIRVWEGSTQLPKSPPHIEGVMNLRGEVVPIVCLRQRFRLPAEPAALRPIIIVFQSEGRTYGTKVDSVNEVHDLGGEDLAPLPEAANPELECFTQGLVTVGGRMLILLDVDTVLGGHTE